MVKSEVELLLKYEMKSLRFHDENYKEVSEILVHIVSKASIKFVLKKKLIIHQLQLPIPNQIEL